MNTRDRRTNFKTNHRFENTKRTSTDQTNIVRRLEIENFLTIVVLKLFSKKNYCFVGLSEEKPIDRRCSLSVLMLKLISNFDNRINIF